MIHDLLAIITKIPGGELGKNISKKIEADSRITSFHHPEFSNTVECTVMQQNFLRHLLHIVLSNNIQYHPKHLLAEAVIAEHIRKSFE